MKYEIKGNDIILTDVKCFDLALCCDCGQAFRWKKDEQGNWKAVVKNTKGEIIQKDGITVFKNTDKKTFEEIWIPYFDLERDYEKILAGFDDKYLKEACRVYPGIRILKQDSWEALCSFIISQNNNIPRIKGIIDRFCRSFGERTGEDDFTFPTFEKTASLSENDLAPLRAGFRNKYILDAAKKLAQGEISLDSVEKMPIEQAREELMKIKGVGKKVAECTLLYGFGRVEAFPVDVWVKRIMGELYPNGLPECTKGVEGIAQQYLFHWRRNIDEKEIENIA
ncbi:MAG: DNA-3-methyladenine glycosylase family protein [Acutalibacteraceae bacterium]